MSLILILSIISVLIAQFSKFFITSNKLKLNWKSFFAYSGMPSSHSALVVSLATIAGLEFGISSPVFAISLIVAFITIRDALGIRRYLGQHGKTLNILVKDLRGDLDEDYPRLLEKIGHTPSQVLAGSIIGFLVSVIGFYLA